MNTNVSNWPEQVTNGRKTAWGVCGCVCAMLVLCVWVHVYSHKHTFPHACETDDVRVIWGSHKMCCDKKKKTELTARGRGTLALSSGTLKQRGVDG